MPDEYISVLPYLTQRLRDCGEDEYEIPILLNRMSKLCVMKYDYWYEHLENHSFAQYPDFVPIFWSKSVYNGHYRHFAKFGKMDISSTLTYIAHYATL